MIKTGRDLPLGEVTRRYKALTGQRGMPLEFYDRVLDVVDTLSGLRMVDVGCGEGTLLKKAAERWPTAELFGVDISPPEPLLQRERIRLITADLRGDLPFRSQCVDLVMCTETLEHLPEPNRYLHEMARILRPNGRLVVTIPNATGYFPFHYLGWWIPTRTLRRKFLPYEHPANTTQPVDTMYEFVEILDLIHRNGFRIQRLHGYRYFRYLLGLRVIGRVYERLAPFVERIMHRIGGQRFAYNLIFLLVRHELASTRT